MNTYDKISGWWRVKCVAFFVKLYFFESYEEEYDSKKKVRFVMMEF